MRNLRRTLALWLALLALLPATGLAGNKENEKKQEALGPQPPPSAAQPRASVPPEAEAAYRRFVALGEGRGFELLPDAPPEYDDSDPRYVMLTRKPFAGLDWTTVQQGDIVQGTMILAYRGSKPQAEGGVLYPLAIAALLDLEAEEAASMYERLMQEGQASGGGTISLQAGDVLLDYADDNIGTLLVVRILPGSTALPDQASLFVPPEAEKAYQRYRALCEEKGFTMLPDEEAVPEAADDGSGVLIMMRLPTELCEWGLVYMNDSFIGYSLCVHKGTPAFDRVEELMAMEVTVLLDKTLEQAALITRELVDGMGADEATGSFGMLTVGDMRLLAAEDGIRFSLQIIPESMFK